MEEMSRKVSDRIQEADISRNWSHVLNFKDSLAELKRYINNLTDGILFTPDVLGHWQGTALKLHNKLEEQRQQWKLDVPWRFEDPEQTNRTINHDIGPAQEEKDKEYNYTPTKFLKEKEVLDQTTLAEKDAMEKEGSCEILKISKQSGTEKGKNDGYDPSEYWAMLTGET